jgi:hypothetical protein
LTTVDSGVSRFIGADRRCHVIGIGSSKPRFLTWSGLMRGSQVVRLVKWLAPGVILLQAASCDPAGFNDLLQTVLLGVTAAGSIAILQNV